MSILRRRVEVQVPLTTDARNYDAVAALIARTLNAHDFPVREATPGWSLTVPARILLRFGGDAFRDAVPQRLAYFRGPSLEVALYANTLLLRGDEQVTTWAHGLVVEALTEAPAFQTFDPAAQAVEQQIRRVWKLHREAPRAHANSAVLLRRLSEIAQDVGKLAVPYDEWQIVYRQTLQLDRALHGQPQLLEATVTKRDPGFAHAAEEQQMAISHRGDSMRNLSTRALISEITAKAFLLTTKQVELAKGEVRADLASELVMAKAFGLALVAALAGLNLLLVAGVFAFALVIPGWAAALFVGGGLLIVGAVVGYVGWTRRVTAPLALTRQMLKEDVQWMKERVA
jgi:hypothetical protein